MLTKIGHTLFGIGLMLLGAGIFIGGMLIGAAWVAFCFGTVVVGVLLLIFIPTVLLAPFTISSLGGPFFNAGWALLNKAWETKAPG